MERELKIKEDRNQTSTITKPPLPPNNNQQGASTNAKETWSPKPVKCYQGVCSMPPNRASPSGAGSELAVSVSLPRFGSQHPAGVVLRSQSLPHCGVRQGEAAPQRTKNGSSGPTSLS